MPAKKKSSHRKLPFGITLVHIVTSFFAGIALAGVLVFLNIQTAHGQKSIDPSRITGEFDNSIQFGEFYGRKILATNTLSNELQNVPSESSDQPKRIEVDLTNQRVYAYQGNEKVFDFLVSTGKWGRTPTGTFKIWGKFKATKMSGGSRALRTYYYLPNVPFVMFFSNEEIPASRGFSFHGTYWHDNFGTPMSHGCINMRTEEAELLYYWANPVSGTEKTTKATKTDPGTEVIIYGVAPRT